MSFALLRWRTALATAALVTGCGTSGPAEDEQPSGGDESPIEPTPVPDADPPPPPQPDAQPLACSDAIATGTTLFALDTGAGALHLHTDLAVDAAGDIFYARGNAVVKYAPTGAVVYRVPYGEAVAVDALGNAYIAASFAAPLDIGLGAMVPEGNVDVFIAKLAPDGSPIFGQPLHLCGDGVRSLAVAADGRIAVSGTALGTVVLDAHGKVLFEKAFSGDLAFDSTGNLVVAGSASGTIYFGAGNGFTTAAGDTDGFVVKLDVAGNHVWSFRLGDADLPAMLGGTGLLVSAPTSQLATSVAIDAHDNVAVVGQFDFDLKLFGTNAVAAYIEAASEQLRSGVFTAVIGATGTVVTSSTATGFDGTAGVAFDAKGRMLTTGMELAEAAPPFRYATLARTIDAVPGFVNMLGAGHAVVADPCGDIVWSASIRGVDGSLTSKLFKIAH